MLEVYRQHVAERAMNGLPPLPLSAEQVAEIVKLLQRSESTQNKELLDLLIHCVPPGVDQAAYVKASFLTAITKNQLHSPLIDASHATEILGTMLGGYNIHPLIELLDNETLAPIAARALSHTLLLFDAFHDVVEKAKSNAFAKQVLTSWANAEWFLEKPSLPEKLTLTIFKVDGEINTDDLSPAQEAWSRPDIPLHAKAMLRQRLPNALEFISELKQKGHPIAFVGDVVGTGSSRKSAINSVLWHIGHDIPYVPNKRQGGVILGGKIAPIFFNTAEDSGALPIELDVSKLNSGDVVHLYPFEGRLTDEAGRVLASFHLMPTTMPDEVRAGGRIPLIIGRSLTDKARQALNSPPSDLFGHLCLKKVKTRGLRSRKKWLAKPVGWKVSDREHIVNRL